MTQYIIKVFISAVLVVSVSELGKRNTLWAALLASLPLLSIMAFVWLYVDTGDVTRLAQMSYDVFWLVLPSLALFLILPVLLTRGMNFWLSLVLACAVTVLGYWLMLLIKND